MTGFLLTLPFQPAFATIDSLEGNLYLALLITATLATVMAIAPVSFHRILFGHPGAKTRIVVIPTRCSESPSPSLHWYSLAPSHSCSTSCWVQSPG